MAAWPINDHSAQQMMATQGPETVIDNEVLPVVQALDKVRQDTELLDERMKQFELNLVNVQYRIQELRKNDPHPQQMHSIGQSEEWVQIAHQELTRTWTIIQERTADMQSNLKQLQFIEHEVLDRHVADWRRLQQLAANGLIVEDKLERIQLVCEAAVESIWRNLQLVQQMNYAIIKTGLAKHSQVAGETLTAIEERFRALLSHFVCGTFVVEKQPPQVMKTNTRFSTSIRMLIGGRLNIYLAPPEVTVSIISEGQARALTKNEARSPSEVSGEILNNRGFMEYNAATRILSMQSRSLSLRKIRRAEKRGPESVMEEKFYLLFQAGVKIGDMSFGIRTLSLPVVVIVHGNQEPDAWATVTWDNAFSQITRTPFTVPDAVPWRDMARVLSTKFGAATGRELSDRNLHLLATKAFRDTSLRLDCGEMMISWIWFYKETLPDRNFSFWKWFYAIMKVTREHIRQLWQDGAILGFIGRSESENILKMKPDGTFLLRFSDSELGGVSIAYVTECNGQKNVLMVHPFTAKDLNVRRLADRISDLTALHLLYPETPKDEVFGKYCDRSQLPIAPKWMNGYIQSTLVNTLMYGALPDPRTSTPPQLHGHSESGTYPVSHDDQFADPSSQMFAINKNELLKRRRPHENDEQNWQGNAP